MKVKSFKHGKKLKTKNFRHGAKKKTFTLIEVLAIIAFISILIIMLLAVVGGGYLGYKALNRPTETSTNQFNK